MQNDHARYWYKEKPENETYWLYDSDIRGDRVFSFDKKTMFHLFQDYPMKLTEEQKRIFDKENPFWANFFSDRGD